MITPNFGKKITAKAIQSKAKARSERQTYMSFLQRLIADNEMESRLACNSYDESEEDDVFDVVTLAVADSDEVFQGTEKVINSIPDREILDLFAEDDYNSISIDDCDSIEGSSAAIELVEQSADFKDEHLIRTIEKHVNIYFQLLVQNLALAGEIKEADQVWVTCLKLMIKLKELVDSVQSWRFEIHGGQGLGLLMRILRQSPIHEDMLNKITKLTNDPDLRLRASIKHIPFKLKNREGKYPCFSKSFWHLLSIFGDPYDENYALIAKNEPLLVDENASTLSQPSGNHPASDVSSIPSRSATTPGEALMLLGDAARFQGRRLDSFLPVEDRLMIVGLKRYGLENWEKIQAHLLPTRTAKQLWNRYKNLTTRRAPENLVKAFAEEAMKPLSKIEEGLLMQGVRTYGDDWSSISTRFLPHRPPSILRRLWIKIITAAIRSAKRQGRTAAKGILDVHFPTDDESDSDYVE